MRRFLTTMLRCRSNCHVQRRLQPLCCWRVFRATCSDCMKQRGNGDFDGPHRAVFRVEARYPPDLLNETAHQAIERNRLAVTRRSEGAVRRSLYVRKAETQRFSIAAGIDRSRYPGDVVPGLSENLLRQIGDHQIIFGDQYLEHAQSSGLANTSLATIHVKFGCLGSELDMGHSSETQPRLSERSLHDQ
jgi:hypothetical protein